MTPSNLISYAVQSGVILVIGLAAARALGLRLPAISLRYWQALLAAVLLLPVLQPWRAAASSVTVEAVGLRLAGTISEKVPGGHAVAAGEWLLLAVAAVAAVRLGWLAVGLAVLQRYRRGARPLTRVPAALGEMLERSGSRVRLLVSDRVPSPVTFGWRRPTVLVPPAFETLPESHQVCIGCHELLHVRRRDWLAVVAEQLLRAVLWFHPAVVVLLGRIELAREQLVDREVVTITGDRRAYLDALVSMARRQQPRAPAPALFLLKRNDLRERVALLAREVRMSKQRVLAAAAAAIAIVAAAGVSAAVLFPLTNAAGGAANAAAATAGEEVRHPIRYEPDSGITEPKILHKVAPVYPEEARKNRIQGKVVSEALIDRHGDVVDVKVIETADEIFNQPTIDAITQWTFEPATKDGEPVDVIYTLTVKYALE